MIRCVEVYNGDEVLAAILKNAPYINREKNVPLRISEYYDGNMKEAVLSAGIFDTGNAYIVRWSLIPAGIKCTKWCVEKEKKNIFENRLITDGHSSQELIDVLQSAKAEAMQAVAEIAEKRCRDEG